eukprot:GHVP01005222.1.p2 GENE.GHVP01005222.1~~GHVP01005222.1.p2  ORF type:complete len:217 (-),score=46.25 GHVP01005222.1:1834-2484(-)
MARGRLGKNAEKHVVKRSVHLQRNQPEDRKHLGYLEKKQDYVKRARRQEVLKKEKNSLYEAARLRNPDEFNYKMVTTETRGKSGRTFTRFKMKDGSNFTAGFADWGFVDEEEKEETKVSKSEVAFLETRYLIDKKRFEKFAENLNLESCSVSNRIEFDEDGNKFEVKDPVEGQAVTMSLFQELQRLKEKFEKSKEILSKAQNFYLGKPDEIFKRKK